MVFTKLYGKESNCVAFVCSAHFDTTAPSKPEYYERAKFQKTVKNFLAFKAVDIRDRPSTPKLSMCAEQAVTIRADGRVTFCLSFSVRLRIGLGQFARSKSYARSAWAFSSEPVRDRTSTEDTTDTGFCRSGQSACLANAPRPRRPSFGSRSVCAICRSATNCVRYAKFQGISAHACLRSLFRSYVMQANYIGYVAIFENGPT